MTGNVDHWFQHFLIESDERPDSKIVWADQVAGLRFTRKPTRAEKLSVVLIGVTGIGLIVLMIVTIVVAVYISRR